jgi:hypothetical protein
VAATESRQPLGAERGQAQSDHTVIVAIAFPSHQAGLRGAVDEPDRAVVTQQQRLGDVTHGRAARALVAAYREEELVLPCGHPEGLGLLLAPAEEAAELRAERQEPSVVTTRELVG